MTAPLLPAYGRGALADVLGSVAARLGVDGAEDVLGLPESGRWVVFLVDGFGWEQVSPLASDLPYLGGLLQAGRPITVGVPSTTATSITSLGTGLVPGTHGIAGYRFRLPEDQRVFCPLTWDTTAMPASVQPRPTWFERIAGAGLAASAVAPAHFDGSGLTGAALRGARFSGLEDEDDDQRRIDLICEAVDRGPGVVYGYDRHLDHTGHSLGVASWQWRDVLDGIDDYLGRLREALPSDVRLLVTGDHGMIDVPEDQRIVIEDDAALMAGVGELGGEGRFRHVYTDDPDGVAARWRDVLGERAWVRTRGEAVDDGWFGDLAPENADRFGDVVVAMRGTWALMTRTLPKEWQLVGMHASLTSAEMLVPLLLD